MDLDRLQALAAAAPAKGPWEFEMNHRGDPHVLEPRQDGIRYMVVQTVNAGPKTAEYIAAVDPQTVLQLVAEVRASRKARDELVAFHDEYDSSEDQFAVTGRLFRIIYPWDKATGRQSDKST